MSLRTAILGGVVAGIIGGWYLGGCELPNLRTGNNVQPPTIPKNGYTVDAGKPVVRFRDVEERISFRGGTYLGSGKVVDGHKIEGDAWMVRPVTPLQSNPDLNNIILTNERGLCALETEQVVRLVDYATRANRLVEARVAYDSAGNRYFLRDCPNMR
ncbi:hypothetical protein HYY74_00330 [Candidatus Woesearchaeota archaeon]|nr:hypothetical protein [Candidatus Woesearchaeota archaeon]